MAEEKPKYVPKKCEHGKQKSRCKECGGSSFCEHGKQKSQCKECGGSSICEHGKRKSSCKECGGSAFCEHGKLKAQCKECGGSSICEHGKRKSSCKECGGSAICEHGRRKPYCKDCNGSAFCEHSKQKARCKECRGSAICEHDKEKSRCKECGGSDLCKTSLCEKRGIPHYNDYCLTCVIQVHPEIPVSRNYKSKENDVVSRITTVYSDFTWVADKRVKDGCSGKRPDLLLHMGSYIIIVEIDENKHNGYDCSCEHKRLMQLSQDLEHRPIIFIRFNPDGYTNEKGELISSCWKLNKLGVMTIAPKKQKEWEERIEILKHHIQYWIENPSEKTIEIVELYY
jgi:hypothetical protein